MLRLAQLPDESVDAAGIMLTRAQDPMLAALEAAPLDDAPYTEDDRAKSDAGWAEYELGEVVKVGELLVVPKPELPGDRVRGLPSQRGCRAQQPPGGAHPTSEGESAHRRVSRAAAARAARARSRRVHATGPR